MYVSFGQGSSLLCMDPYAEAFYKRVFSLKKLKTLIDVGNKRFA